MSEAIPLTEVQLATDEVLYLGGFAVWYADVKRATRYPERTESDVEHSYMLSMIALNLAERFYPELDQALIAQFCLIHDAPEAITGDVPTFDITDVDRAAKEQAEADAVDMLVTEMPTYWTNLLVRYESERDSEARFVRLVDKLMPPVTNVVGDGATTYANAYGIHNLADLDKRKRRGAELRELYPEFPEIHEIRESIVEIIRQTLFDTETGEIILNTKKDE